jgi:two-component system CheB/CheR fusion protein
MAAKKRTTKGPGAAKPARQSVKAPDPSEESAATAANSASTESKPDQWGPPVVGIGASAGGLDAFKRFFGAMPADSGIAFVLVPHLDPAHESLMVELLARHTVMPVVEAENDMPVEANHVYIIPPNKYITIHGGTLSLTGPVERWTSQTTIDQFLRSLADDQQERAICIILSGTGAHGTLGLKAVKVAGGMAMVQDPATAEYERMPQSAIATGLADYVLPAERMPEALIKYVQHAYVNGGTRIAAAPEAGDSLTQVLALLQARTGFDFRPYRKKMLTRRVERRMGLNHLDSIPDYMTFLRDHQEEAKQLVKDLLISVTSFFRDPEAFEALASQVIAPLVRRKEPDGVIRVWVPGCATGEEAYSLVILLLEQLAAAKKNCALQVFATDVDQDALDVARQGLYPESIAGDVTLERLARYFTRVDESSYQVNKQVREVVTFASQNLITDAPFSKMDLISCRNLLIYLEPEVQQMVVALLHFALNEGGNLILGPSETVGRQTDLFEPVSKKWRVFRRLGASRPERVEFPIVTREERARQVRLPGEPGRERPFNVAELTQRLVLEELGPAAVLINRKYEILYYLGPTSRYLDQPTGEPTRDLMLLARDGLRTQLRAAVHKAMRSNETVDLTDVQVKRNGDYRPVAVRVKPVPVPRSAEGLLLITFQDQPDTVPSPAPPTPATEESLVRHLENELRVTKEDLQTTIEELESSNEELKASNEEVMSMNEELQSANEELTSSKEELQSLNEELTTVNNQLQEKVHDVETASNDMANLLNCTDVATVFLDSEFRIKRFTPTSTRLFNFVASDLGRPLGDIKARFNDPDLLGDAGQVLRQLTPREKEVLTTEGGCWSRRILPYRTSDHRVEGVVITFADITERQRAAEQALRDRQERLQAVLDTAVDAIITIDQHGIIQSVNAATERMFGYGAGELIGHNVKLLMPPPYKDEHDGYLARYRQTGQKHIIGIGREVEGRRKDGSIFPLDLAVSEIAGQGQRSFTGMMRDLSVRRALEQEVLEVATVEQQRIGQELHDTTAQELAALELLAGSILPDLQEKAPAEASVVAKMAEGLKRVLGQVHAIARGLIRVEVDAEGLMAALSDLAAQTTGLQGVTCTFDCKDPVHLTDNRVATQLYCIAREGVSNGLKHAHARQIRISLEGDDQSVTLRVQDDGDGLPATPIDAKGMGLKIMRYRAGLIQAHLSVGLAEPGGTAVTCTCSKGIPHVQDQVQGQ